MIDIKFIYDFIRLWIYYSDYKEAWQDANFINDKKIQKELDDKFDDFKLKYYDTEKGS